MDKNLCLRFKALKDLPCDEGFFSQKVEILVETHPTSRIFRREDSPGGKQGLSLSCFPINRKQIF